MQEGLFGTLTVRLRFTKHVDGKRMYMGNTPLVRFHGTLQEVKPLYREWREQNPHIADSLQATFEVRMAVHADD
jgi:hypothetical protein